MSKPVFLFNEKSNLTRKEQLKCFVLRCVKDQSEPVFTEEIRQMVQQCINEGLVEIYKVPQ